MGLLDVFRSKPDMDVIYTGMTDDDRRKSDKRYQFLKSQVAGYQRQFKASQEITARLAAKATPTSIPSEFNNACSGTYFYSALMIVYDEKLLDVTATKEQLSERVHRRLVQSMGDIGLTTINNPVYDLFQAKGRANPILMEYAPAVFADGFSRDVEAYKASRR